MAVLVQQGIDGANTQHTNKCERPWELATKVGIENTVKAYNEYCGRALTK